MNANSFIANFKQTQDALLLLNLLQVFGTGWPGAHVNNESTYDYIVVGGGTAGSVVASRLAEDSTLKVLLIESGGDPPIEATVNGLSSSLYFSRYAHYYETEPNPNIFQCHRGKKYVIQTGKMLGGSSSFNAGGFERGTVEDYDLLAKTANDPDWSFESLLPYFKKSEGLEDAAVKNSKYYSKYHGFHGPTVVTRDTRPQTEGYLKALKELGNNIVIDLTGNTTVGYIQPLMSASKEGRSSAAKAYLSSPIENLDILKNTDVTKILFDKNKNAIGVKAGHLTFYAKQEVILSAGIFGTTKLLLLSGIGPRKDLESNNIPVISDLPVGENFQDSAAVLLFHKLRKTKKPQPPSNIYQFPYPFIIGFATPDKSSTIPKYATVGYVMSNYKNVYGFCILRSFEHSLCDRLLDEIKSGEYDVLVSYIWKASPRSRGKVSLRTANIADPLIVDSGIFKEDRDLDDYVEYIKDYIKIENTTYFKEQDGQFIDPMNGCKDKYRSDDYWRCYSRCLLLPITHAIGTNPIGIVVDTRLNVKGVQRLRIADASIFPKIITGGTASSTLVVGEKAAAMIKEDRKCG